MISAPDPHRDGAEIRLDANEAIVLFELLSRWCDRKATRTPSSDCFEHNAECAVLNDILATLESQMVAPLQQNYKQTLEDARNSLASKWSYPTLAG